MKTIADALDAAAEEVDNHQDSTPEETGKPERRSVADLKTTADRVKETAEPAKWKTPGWTKRWKADRAAALEKLATHPEFGNDAKSVVDGINDVYREYGRSETMRGQLEKRFGPVSDLLGQADHMFTLRGQSLQQGLGQMLLSPSLYRNQTLTDHSMVGSDVPPS